MVFSLFGGGETCAAVFSDVDFGAALSVVPAAVELGMESGGTDVVATGAASGDVAGSPAGASANFTAMPWSMVCRAGSRCVRDHRVGAPTAINTPTTSR